MKQPKVYVKKYDKIFDVIEIHFDIKVVYFDDGISNEYMSLDFDEVEFIYNTGYKDVNGAYIYTGDILEYVRGEAIFNGKKFLLKKSAEQEFYYLASKKFCGIQLSDMDTTEELSVIGNIYENKYLWED